MEVMSRGEENRGEGKRGEESGENGRMQSKVSGCPLTLRSDLFSSNTQHHLFL
jgi:hypothetical protein